MEIFDEVGVADAIYRRGTPVENMRRTALVRGADRPARRVRPPDRVLSTGQI